MRRQQRHQPYRPGAANHQRIAEAQTTALDPRERDGERFEQGALFERHGGGELVHPGGRVGVVATQGPVDGGRGIEGHGGAGVVLAGAAGAAGGGGAGDAVFEGYAVAWTDANVS